MSSRGPYRRHAPQFNRQLCQDIGSGVLRRRDAQKKYSLLPSTPLTLEHIKLRLLDHSGTTAVPNRSNQTGRTFHIF